MSPDEIQAALQAAFYRCDVASCPLSDTQKEILLQVVEQVKGNFAPDVLDTPNPLDELTQEELEAFLKFVKTQQEQNCSWKAQLLNDWLLENDSGQVQFIRDRYGLTWLDRIEEHHFEKYANALSQNLKVGDRIEVCNALWEWVQDDGPCSREWYPCIIVQLEEKNDGQSQLTNCIIRFNNGQEYEIQGFYQWNRFYWRRIGQRDD
ncbi:MAG: hypothetical protein SAK29_39135 [Scytonema sp. PMC 1069.18]|nr:hypothetical protein [Scytonema sp. PMC 1069.18]MEC4884962.1 hypothetical protein [Scytonema sp. PMC 1070.18]